MAPSSHTDHSLAIGLGVGLAVGVPILLTLMLLVWVTVRHRRKVREEDEEHEKIDFNGEVSFWSMDDSSHVPSDEVSKLADNSMYELDPSQPGSSVGPPSVRAPSVRASSIRPSSIRASSIRGSLRNGSMATGLPAPMAPLSVYAPSIDGHEQDLTRQLNSVYGPSPAYPSSERLRLASTGSVASMHSPRTPGMHYGEGPFATPPRFAPGERRMSNGSLKSSSYADSELHPAGTLKGVKESPHPYADLAGETALNTGAVVPDDTLEMENRERGKHVYHTQAENRQSVFEY